MKRDSQANSVTIWAVAGGAAALGGLTYLGWRLSRAPRHGALPQRLPGAHVSETAAQYARGAHRILILGSGFGGLTTARELDRKLPANDSTSVLAIDRSNSLLFTPLLWTVADGRAAPNSVVVPVRAFQRKARFHVLQAEIERIDLDQRVVHTSAGDRPYDTLVLALGSITRLPNLPGVREYARIFHTPANAVELRNRLIDAIEAAHNALDPQERNEWLTFVVSGGGDTGIELAAVISTYVRSGLLHEYPWLAGAPVRIVVVGRAERLVPMSEPETSAAVRRALEAEGIEVWTGASVEGITERMVRTTAGEIAARTVFWAAGVTAPPVIRALPVAHAPNGSVVVDDHLRLPDHPEVYAVGDCAWAFDAVTGRALPPTAQAAEHMGVYVARAIAASLAGGETGPLRFLPKGSLALLGRHTGVGRVGPITVTGFPAWLLWHAYYLSHIPSWRNRAQLVVNWLLTGIAGRETGELRLAGNQATEGAAATQTVDQARQAPDAPPPAVAGTAPHTL